MSKSGTVFLVFLLMGKLSFSQAGYPALLIINGDSIGGVTMPQVDSINKTRINLSECDTLARSLQNSLNISNRLSIVKDRKLSNLRFQLQVKDSVIVTYEKELLLKDKINLHSERNAKWWKGGFIGAVAYIIYRSVWQ